MSAVYFCDECGKQMRDNEMQRIKRKLGNVSIEITRAHNDVWNGGHVCHACIIKTVNEGATHDS